MKLLLSNYLNNHNSLKRLNIIQLMRDNWNKKNCKTNHPWFHQFIKYSRSKQKSCLDLLVRKNFFVRPFYYEILLQLLSFSIINSKMAEFNECQSRFLSLNLFTTSRNSKSSLNIKANAASCNRNVNPLKPLRAYSYLSFNQGNAKLKSLIHILNKLLGL